MDGHFMENIFQIYFAYIMKNLKNWSLIIGLKNKKNEN